MRNNKGPNIIVERSFQFAIDIIKYSEILEKQHKFVIAKQLQITEIIKILSKIISSSKQKTISNSFSN